MKPEKRIAEVRDRGNIIGEFSEALRSISVSEGQSGASVCFESKRQTGFARQGCLQKQFEVPDWSAASAVYIVRRTMYTTTSSEPGNRVRKHEESPGSQGQDAS